MVELWLKYGKTEIFVDVPPEVQYFVVEPSKPAEIENVEEDVESAIKSLGHEELERSIHSSKKISLLVDTQLPFESFLRVYKKLVSFFIQHKSDMTSFSVLLLPWRYGKVGIERFTNVEDIDTAGIDVVVVDRYSESSGWVLDDTSDLQVHHEYLNSDLKLVLLPTEYHGAYGLLDYRHTIVMGAVYARSRPKRAKSIESLWEVTKNLKPNIVFQTVHSDKKGLVKVFAGQPEQVATSASILAYEVLTVKLKNKADIIIASPGGAPYDSTLMSALQTLGNLEHIIKNDGILILASECINGLGGLEFAAELGRYASEKDDYRPTSIINQEAVIINKFRSISRKCRIALVSTLPKVYVERLLGAKAFDTLSDALSYALRIKGKECSIALIPDATRILASLEGEGNKTQNENPNNAQNG
ncbi:MAG: hypothetical protein RMJ14_04930 [Nitrososphaerota archaeon]|nr:hypothetical protein [Aigarchaeota archaeon]MDW8076963.1 hypothetical protein [Nitrososphaerota archaeon]